MNDRKHSHFYVAEMINVEVDIESVGGHRLESRLETLSRLGFFPEFHLSFARPSADNVNTVIEIPKICSSVVSSEPSTPGNFFGFFRAPLRYFRNRDFTSLSLGLLHVHFPSLQWQVSIKA